MPLNSDTDLPGSINYWITNPSKHDCFFNVGGDSSGSVERIGAIKIFLTGVSDVFRRMLDESPLAETGVIAITDTDPGTFKYFLACIYGGTEIVVLHISFEECLKLLSLCDKYMVFEVMKTVSRCMLELHQPLSFDNVLLALMNPGSLNDKNFEAVVSNIVQDDTEKFIEEGVLLNFVDSDGLVFIAKQTTLSCKEITLWNACLEWAKHKVGKDYTPENLRSCLGRIIKFIRFSSMGSEDFCAHVVPSDVLTPEEVVEICKSIGTKVEPNLKYVSNIIVNRFKQPCKRWMFSLTYVFNNIQSISSTETSKKVFFGNFVWSIQLVPKADFVGLYLFCNSLYHLSFECNTIAEIEIVHHYCKEQSFKRSIVHTYVKNEGWGHPKFITWKKLLLRENGFIKNRNLEVVVHVEFTTCD